MRSVIPFLRPRDILSAAVAGRGDFRGIPVDLSRDVEVIGSGFVRCMSNAGFAIIGLRSKDIAAVASVRSKALLQILDLSRCEEYGIM